MISEIPSEAFERQYLRARVIATGLLICMAGLFAVSYTHLTLPTILRV